nr:hypothetical protein [Tanacetum cinerariifolium]
MGEPLSPDCVFDFPKDEMVLHLAYDFFAPGPILGYADEPMVGPIADEIAEPANEAEEQVVAPVVSMDKDIAMLFGDDCCSYEMIGTDLSFLMIFQSIMIRGLVARDSSSSHSLLELLFAIVSPPSALSFSIDSSSSHSLLELLFAIVSPPSALSFSIASY